MKSLQDKWDAYDCILSEEIQKYFRDTIEPISETEINLTAQAFIPVWKKIEIIKDLLPPADRIKEGIEYDGMRFIRTIGLEWIRLFSDLVDEFTAESNNTIYILEEMESKYNYRHDLSVRINDEIPCHGFEVFASYREVLEFIKAGGSPEDNGQRIYNITKIIRDTDKCTIPYELRISWFEGKPEIYNVRIYDEELKSYGFSKEFIYNRSSNTCRHLPLPFRTGDKVAIKIPTMNEPVEGKIKSAMDGNRCWYHFFYPYWEEYEKGWAIDLHYHMIDLVGEFSVFDWVYRIEE